LETEEIATECKQSTIILLHKKGPKDDINNYRPINLLPNLYKLFVQIITKRMFKILDDNQPVEQAGFRSQFCTIDHLQATNQLIEKAFDSVEHKPILQTLKTQGVQNKYITLLANLYTECKAKIQTQIEGNAFPLERGVKQGDLLTPKLFTIVFKNQMRKLEWETKHGINIDGQRLIHLRFSEYHTNIKFSQRPINDAERPK
jgi:Reverse transcriptase (RNA-dependent DNA polymerase).